MKNMLLPLFTALLLTGCGAPSGLERKAQTMADPAYSGAHREDPVQTEVVPNIVESVEARVEMQVDAGLEDIRLAEPVRPKKPIPPDGGVRGVGFDASHAQLGPQRAVAKVVPGPQPSFTGIDFDTNSSNTGGNVFIPPDNHIAVGGSHIVIVTNTSMQVFNKGSTPTLAANRSLRTFFNALAPQTFTFDPKVLYDRYSDRYLILTMEQTESPQTSRVFVAVSNTNNPTGTWRLTSVNTKLTINSADRWADFPGFAVDEEAVYFSANMFSFIANGGAYAGSRLWIITKSTFYSGGTVTVKVLNPYSGLTPGDASTTMLARLSGSTPTSLGTFLVSTGWNSGATDQVRILRIDNPLNTTPTINQQFLSLGDIDNQALPIPEAPQQGSAIRIDAGDRRAADPVFRDNNLYVAFTTRPGSGVNTDEATVRWLRINTQNLASLSVAEQGAIGGEELGIDTFTYYPAIAVNDFGHVAIGFSASGATRYVSSYMVSRRSDDAAGTVSTPELLRAGVDFYVRTFTSDQSQPNRWGDYSGAVTDPSNQCFWIYNQHASTQAATPLLGERGRWATAGQRYCVCRGTESSGDSDFDGVCSNLDNCDNDANPDQADGDNDGIGDACDPCPTVSGTQCNIATTTTITSDNPDPSDAAQSYAVAVSVRTSSQGNPTGSVNINDGTGATCTATLNASANGSCNLTSTTAGNKTLTAAYVATPVFNASSDVEPHTVTRASTTTTITARTPNPSLVGQAVTVSWNVAAPAAVALTGAVTVTVSGGSESCTANLPATSCSLTLLSAGARTLTASYAGNANLDPSSGTASQTVNRGTTVLTIASDNPDPSFLNQNYTVQVTTSTSNGSPIPTGSVAVNDGDGASCNLSLSAGSGSCVLSSSSVGSKTLTATYPGDSANLPDSDTELHSVQRATSTTLIESDLPDPSVAGQSYLVQARVTTQAGAPQPTGTVTIGDGTNSCNATLSAGLASCSLVSSTVGALTLSADYAGNAGNLSSSDTEAHQVERATSTLVITQDTPDPSQAGEAITVTVALSANAPSNLSLAGANVVVSASGGSETCTIVLPATSCVLNLSGIGVRTLSANFAGNPSIQESSDTEPHTVEDSADFVFRNGFE